MPKLITLTGSSWSSSFQNPRIITLESISYHSTLTSRHALSHHCHSWQGVYFQVQENHSHQESLFLLSLIPRHHSSSSILSPVHCFFHTPLSSQHQIAVFTSHNNYSFPSSLSHFLFLPAYRMSCYQAFLHDNSLIS